MTGSPVAPQTFSLDNLKRQADRLRHAGSLLGRGALVALPTECGYVVAARADREDALQCLLGFKGERDQFPLTLLVEGLHALRPFLQSLPPEAESLTRTFWPGPLQLVFARAGSASPLLSTRLAKVACLAPSHPLAQAVVRQCNFPLAACPLRVPRRAETDPAALVRQAAEGTDAVLEWRDPPLDLEPTVVDMVGSPRVVRLGFVTVEELTRVLGRRPLLSGDAATPSRFTRYAPEARMIVVEGDTERVARRLKFLRDTYAMTERIVIVTTREMAETFLGGMNGIRAVGSRQDAVGYGRAVASVLAEVESQQSATMVMVEGVPREGAGVEVMEQLARSAHQVINTEDPGFAGQAGMKPRESKKR
ncbi:MAG: Sua5/YciO/YrdC/YwlC family protein [Candidatus Eremiobacterota bacterium]